MVELLIRNTNDAGRTMTVAEIRDIITTVIALLALGLSMLSLYLQRRDKRPRLLISDVKIAIMNVSPVDDGGGGTLLESAPGVSLRLRNTGEKEIRLGSVCLCKKSLLARQACLKITPSGGYAPKVSMSPGTSQLLKFRIPDASFLRKRRMYIQIEDEIGNRYRSHLFSVQLDKLKAFN
jgi:hypothetical protein